MDAQTWRNHTASAASASASAGHLRTHAAFLTFNCTVLTLTLLLGLPGNLWVCWVVFRTKSMQTSNNALLVSLAASDLLKCSVDTPLLLMSFVRSGRARRASVCTLQQFTYALCSCVQLLTLVSISVERFQAIAFPFHTEKRKARVRIWILSIWACGLGLALVSLTLSHSALSYLLCRPHAGTRDGGEPARPPDPFGPYVLVPVWGLSLTAIVVHYVRIFKVVRQHRKKVFNRGVQLRPTVSRHAWGWMSVPGPAHGRAFNSLPLVDSSSPMPPRRTMLLVAEANAESAGGGGDALRRSPEIVGAVCLLTPGARERGKKRVEGRLAQRFGYVIIAFMLFWVPMVVILLINVFSWQDRLLMELETSAVVLTCVQAAVDPLLYTFVTKQFRSELSKMLSALKPRA
ncbi:unnamed protein product [Ophioblennius macclurei]